MHVELQNASLRESDVDYLKDINVRFEEGLNVLLGPTLSGKTSLMRALAGLETLDEGRVLYEDKDMSGIAVQKRNIAMVYQQFINYPGLTVYENIASPLRILKKPKAVIDEKVRWAASVLKLDNMLDRMPLELSGGQQQRCALARAIVKEAQLVLLDEPLANLDYKLREELRDELPQIFAQSQSVLVYATSEPEEALKLNGKIAVMHEGSISQFGSTNEVYHQPQSLQTAEIFSDPPMNFVDVEVNNGALVFSAQTTNHEYIFEKVKGVANGKYKAGFRPNHLTLVLNDKSSSDNETVTFTGHTIISELTGSMSYIHMMANTNDCWQFPLADNQHRWVSLNEGIHHVELDKSVQCNVSLSNMYLYQTSGELVFSADARRGL